MKNIRTEENYWILRKWEQEDISRIPHAVIELALEILKDDYKINYKDLTATCGDDPEPIVLKARIDLKYDLF